MHFPVLIETNGVPSAFSLPVSASGCSPSLLNHALPRRVKKAADFRCFSPKNGDFSVLPVSPARKRAKLEVGRPLPDFSGCKPPAGRPKYATAENQNQSN